MTLGSSLALKTAAKSTDDARRLFFTKSDISETDLEKYVSWFAENSKASLDLRDFQKNLPSRYCDTNGQATFITQQKPPTLVLGAANDLIVDATALKETAVFLGNDEKVVTIPNAPHDLMLDPATWRRGLDEITTWMDKVTV